jgi:hypothetical protein
MIKKIAMLKEFNDQKKTTESDLKNNSIKKNKFPKTKLD